MKIGIISDTHDDVANTRKAVEIFEKNKVGLVIHCGDYVFPPLVKEFEKLTKQGIEFVGVLGNNDGEITGLMKTFEQINGKLLGEIGHLKKDGLEICVYHGTNSELKDELAKSGKYDVFVSGHTHRKDPDTSESVVGKTVILNPGTAHRAEKMSDPRDLFRESTVMIFDTATKISLFFDLTQF